MVRREPQRRLGASVATLPCLLKAPDSDAGSVRQSSTGKRRVPRPAKVDLLGDSAALLKVRRDCTTCDHAMSYRRDLCDPYVYCSARPIPNAPAHGPIEARFERRDAAVGCPDLWKLRALDDVE